MTGDALGRCQSMHSRPVISPQSRLSVFTLTILHDAAGSFQLAMSGLCLTTSDALPGPDSTICLRYVPLYNIHTAVLIHMRRTCTSIETGAVQMQSTMPQDILTRATAE